MKSKLFFIISMIIMTSQQLMSQSKLTGDYTLNVDVTELKDKPGKIYFQYYNALTRESVRDSAEISDDVKTNKFTFKGKLEEPILASMRYMPKPVPGRAMMMSNKNSFALYIEPGTMQMVVKDSLSNSMLTGSKTQLDYEKMLAMKKPFDERQKELSARYSAFYRQKDTVSATKVIEEMDALSDEVKEKVYKPFIIQNGATSVVALTALSSFVGYGDMKIAQVEELFGKINPAFKSLPAAKSLIERIDIAKKTGIGSYAMDFTQNDTLGKPVSLSSFKGRYVLVDFWASWCGPCRAENPNLVKSYNHFKDKGFTVLGVSLDQPGKKDLWVKAINDDKLTWTHVSDLAYWNNAVAKMYGVNAVPSNYLIDPQGKIVGKNLRGKDLDKKLGEIFDGKRAF